MGAPVPTAARPPAVRPSVDDWSARDRSSWLPVPIKSPTGSRLVPHGVTNLAAAALNATLRRYSTEARLRPQSPIIFVSLLLSRTAIGLSCLSLTSYICSPSAVGSLRRGNSFNYHQMCRSIFILRREYPRPANLFFPSLSLRDGIVLRGLNVPRYDSAPPQRSRRQ